MVSRAEVEALLGAIEPLACRMVVMTAYGTGLRISEALALETRDIDATKGLVHVRRGKGGRERYVMLPRRLLETLREYWRSRSTMLRSHFAHATSRPVGSSRKSSSAGFSSTSCLADLAKSGHFGLDAPGNVNARLAAARAVLDARARDHHADTSAVPGGAEVALSVSSTDAQSM